MTCPPVPSSLSDTGAEWIEFVPATDDVVELKLTYASNLFWFDDVPPALDVTLSDTGWSDG